ncbi:MAG: D-alanine--D-alanine ligase family protein [Lacisediminihabitans sp.]
MAVQSPATGKLVVAVLFGGRSSEHSISCATAGGVLEAIDRDKYVVVAIGITTDGSFVLEDDDPTRFALNPSRLPTVVDNGTRVHFPESAATREFLVTDAAGTTTSLGSIDVVFPILHGRFGEDGTVQGLLELLGLPYVGAGVLASALAMDKHFTKKVLQQAGFSVAPWWKVTARDSPAQALAHAEDLGWPVFVKPARAGSSVGVSKVSEPRDLATAIELALAEDSSALIEAAMVGREIECGVLGGRAGQSPRVSLAGEVVTSEGEFYDFSAKYLGISGVELVCPASITESQLTELQALAASAFDALGVDGLARVDFFLTASGFVVNEVNTMPGFTPLSMFPRCWIASGLSYPELIDELIQLGVGTVR